jgi:hypothetical protein
MLPFYLHPSFSQSHQQFMIRHQSSCSLPWLTNPKQTFDRGERIAYHGLQVVFASSDLWSEIARFEDVGKKEWEQNNDHRESHSESPTAEEEEVMMWHARDPDDQTEDSQGALKRTRENDSNEEEYKGIRGGKKVAAPAWVEKALAQKVTLILPIRPQTRGSSSSCTTATTTSPEQSRPNESCNDCNLIHDPEELTKFEEVKFQAAYEEDFLQPNPELVQARVSTSGMPFAEASRYEVDYPSSLSEPCRVERFRQAPPIFHRGSVARGTAVRKGYGLHHKCAIVS